MIVCAAIKVCFERNGKTVEAVIPGFRHSDCWELMSTLGLPPKGERQEVEGFIDRTGAFLDRYQAFEHAMQCDQLSDTTRVSKAERGERELFSEDWY